MTTSSIQYMHYTSNYSFQEKVIKVNKYISLIPLQFLKGKVSWAHPNSQMITPAVCFLEIKTSPFSTGNGRTMS